MADHFEQIKKIHQSDAFGVFVELGCGNPVAHTLCEVTNASSTVFFAENPYSKDFSVEKYKLTHRLVSEHTIEQIHRQIKLNFSAKVNLIFISSFQIGEENNISTHGYIGIDYKGNFKIYHVSIHESATRTYYINKLKCIGVELLYKTIFNSEVFYSNLSYVDIVYNIAENKTVSANLAESLEFIKNGNKNNIIYVETGIPKRIEELLRKPKNSIIAYMGSYNPMHYGHERIMETCKNNFDAFPSFGISTNTFGKGEITTKDLMWRIKQINDKGYGVIIYNSPFFIDLITKLKKDCKKTVIIPMGIDTFSRINTGLRHLMDNSQIVIFDRNEKTKDQKIDPKIKVINFDMKISSTEIRNIVCDSLTKDEAKSRLEAMNCVHYCNINGIIDRFFWEIPKSA